jgi:hypothetical protein
MGCTERDVMVLPAPARDQFTEELRTAEQLAQLLVALSAAVARAVGARTAARSGVTVDHWQSEDAATDDQCAGVRAAAEHSRS